MDYFQAESPNGLSTFGVAALSDSGSIPQLLYLTISRLITGSGGGGGGGGGSSWVSSEADEKTTAVPTIAGTSESTSESVSGYAGGMPKATKTQAAAEITPQTPDMPSKESQLPISGGSMLTIIQGISIVFVVVLVSLVFYFRWRTREGGD